MDSPGLQVDYEERVVGDQAPRGPDLGREEVRRSKLAPMGLEEGLPRRRAIRCGLDAIVFECPRDRAAADSVTDVLELTLDPRVSPGRVLESLN